ncbi:MULTISPECIES: NAD(P)-dependent oxidoreductase [unclassified Pseudoclavibacter]|uniref:NAD(P)-dependent oxidoreductase n=1 Tax=unclassified Pseudoclavibacter TaxID=2615177 RepID=UPI001300D16C|nr:MULTISPECIES: NAD(P)-binding domain-containing protein [unclassified Pseudoclavibacter]KAB1647302.1 NAD-binding protein [Pseudoclavibacter sp. CFCC 14310]KAB1662705.1 NAD-binding protein [Pseudoclavibacter sp. CFCC 13611]
MATLGWIGLGNMGGRMTGHLVRAGHTVLGYDLNPAATAAAQAEGVTIVDSIAAALDGADALFTSLPKGQHVRSVYEGADGVWAHAATSTLLIDCSTIDVETSRYLHEQSEVSGHHFVDAPVSGGISGAADGTLAFMLGGDPADTARAAEYIEPMSGSTIVAGGPTMGIAAKIVNNMMLLIDVLANSEGSQLAEELGLDPKVFWQIASASSGRSWAQQTWYPVPGVIPTSAADHNFDATFTADLANKDIGLALEAGRQTGVHLPAATLAADQLQRLIDEGLGGKDCTLVAKYATPDGTLRGWQP